MGQFTEIAAVDDGTTEALLAADTVALLLTVPQVVWSVPEVTCTIALAPAVSVPIEHDNTPPATEHPAGPLASVQSSPELAGSVSLMATPVASPCTRGCGIHHADRVTDLIPRAHRGIVGGLADLQRRTEHHR